MSYQQKKLDLSTNCDGVCVSRLFDHELIPKGKKKKKKMLN